MPLEKELMKQKFKKKFMGKEVETSIPLADIPAKDESKAMGKMTLREQLEGAKKKYENASSKKEKLYRLKQLKELRDLYKKKFGE